MQTEPRHIFVQEPLENQPATMQDIKGLTDITDGLDKSIARMQRTIPSPAEIEEAVAAGIERGMKKVLNDKEFMAGFWESGYVNLAKHAESNAQKWIGKRVMHAITVAVLIGALVWGVKTGRIS